MARKKSKKDIIAELNALGVEFDPNEKYNELLKTLKFHVPETKEEDVEKGTFRDEWTKPQNVKLRKYTTIEGFPRIGLKGEELRKAEELITEFNK